MYFLSMVMLSLVESRAVWCRIMCLFRKPLFLNKILKLQCLHGCSVDLFHHSLSILCNEVECTIVMCSLIEFGVLHEVLHPLKGQLIVDRFCTDIFNFSLPI